MPTLRLLPFEIADGSTNMAADEVMLLAAAEGVASLRFYGWSPATLSLGYFQSAAVRRPELPWVRRATGGATLVHDRELTYALALPNELLTGLPWMPRFHGVIQAALAVLGVEVSLVEVEEIRGDVLCFQKLTPSDLVCRGHKIGGSAQRKHRRALLQHGSVLLRQSEWTPELPGVLELTGRDIGVNQLAASIVGRLIASTGWTSLPDVWTDEERLRITSVRNEKFAASSWNDKR